jgi:uncharacterized protein YktB (UPF0637 family)
MARRVLSDQAFAGFPPAVFDLFRVPEFTERMALLRSEATPRLWALGEALTGDLSHIAGEPLYPHVAMHMRRRVNPPDDTWVAWGRSLRGYKAVIHFEVGVSAQGTFARVVIKSEGQAEKPRLLDRVTPELLHEWARRGPLFWYRDDHGEGPLPLADVTAELWPALRAHALKAANSIAVGSDIPRAEAIQFGPAVRDRLLDRLAMLAPLYHLTRSE